MKIGKFLFGMVVLAVVVLGLTAQTGDWREYRFVPNFSSGTTPGATSPGLPAASGKQNLSGVQEAVAPADRMEKPLLQFRAGGHILGFTPGGVLIASGTHALKMEFIGSSVVQPVSESMGTDEGSSPDQKATPLLSKVSYPGLWTGVTLKYEADKSGVVKSTYEVAPGGDPTAIRLKSNVPIKVDSDGLLHYGFEAGELVESKPVAWQEIGGQRVAVEAGYQIAGEKEFGFKFGSYDRALPLVIDPVLTWNTFIGKAESYDDSSFDILYLIGTTFYVCGTSDGPWGSPVRPYSRGVFDGYVAAIEGPTGNVIWNTFLGGTGADYVYRLVSDGAGNLLVTGSSESTWGSPIRAFAGGVDGFAAKLNATTGALQWNTFLGGTGDDVGNGIAADGSANAYVVGTCATAWGPSPVQAYTAGKDAFVIMLNSSGALQWITFLGGSGSDEGNGIVYSNYDAPNGRLVVVGSSNATWGTSPRRAYTSNYDGFIARLLLPSGEIYHHAFLGGTGNDYAVSTACSTAAGSDMYVVGHSTATWGAPLRAHSLGQDAFVAKVSAAVYLTWNTFLGGVGGDGGQNIKLDASDNVFVVGSSDATWGTTVGYGYHLGVDAFAAKLNSAGAYQWNTFRGGSGADFGNGIALVGSYIVITGYCDSAWTISGLKPYSGGWDGFYSVLTSTGALHTDRSFFGGGGLDEGNAIAVDGSGNIYIAGTSRATWGTPFRPFSGNYDAFVAKLNASGVLQWNTFLGSSSLDYGQGIAVTSAGSAYVTGCSGATWGTPVRPFGGGMQDAFAARLTTGGALQWNTFLGGTGSLEAGRAIAVDTAGHAFVAGYCNSTWGSPVNPFVTGSEGFAAELDSAGALQWNTFFGGSGTDGARGIAVDTSGHAYVTGYSSATWGTPVNAYTSNYDAIAAEFDGNGLRLWNTFLGGSGNDFGNAVAVYGTSAVYIAGDSTATWGTPVRAYGGLDDGFAARLNGSGALVWNTFLGAPGSNDAAFGIDVDGSGNVYVGGQGMHTWGTPFRAYSDDFDAFAARLNSSGVLQWNGFFGSPKSETGGFIAVDGSGNVYLAGTGNRQWGSPVVVSYGGGKDAWLAKISIDALTVTDPNGGEVWQAGTVHNINWTSTGAIANVKLEYSTDGGTNWTTIIASTADDGLYAWTLPMILSTTCRVRVSDAADGIPNDISNANFSIVAGPKTIALSRNSFNFGAERNGTPTPGQTCVLTNSGGGPMSWTATPSVGWLNVAPASGTGDAVLTITVTNTNYAVGTYAGTISIAAVGASNTPQTINVSLKISASGSDAAPFGNFATPTAGSTVMSSVPVTGWVLDDVYVQSVKIYRGTNASNRVYIGDATFVDGARPDIVTAYPTYPMNYRAGWGYMLLTNFLPSGGNGPFTLLAYAKDSKGHEVLLGSKAITCDNAHAVKPFGAIDTPTQGGTATGDSFVNFGWALTPLPDTIAINGSTINVYVDSLPLGHPTYNVFRNDIATAFPGLNNSGGAIGYFYLNTMTMTNGVHTIQWSVADNGGDSDGIGSRYFTVLNLSGGSSGGAEATAQVSNPSTGRTAEDLSFIPEDRQTPVYLKRGFREDVTAEAVYPETEGNARIAIQPLERIAVYWNENDSFESREESLARARRIMFKTDASVNEARFEAYQLVAGEIRPLPIGASFDAKDGIFYWQPGPGFLGEFSIVLVRNDGASLTRKTVKITIVGDLK